MMKKPKFINKLFYEFPPPDEITKRRYCCILNEQSAKMKINEKHLWNNLNAFYLRENWFVHGDKKLFFCSVVIPCENPTPVDLFRYIYPKNFNSLFGAKKQLCGFETKDFERLEKQFNDVDSAVVELINEASDRNYS